MSIAIIYRPHFARALQSRSFALLWTGQTISALGDGACVTALSWQALQLTGSAMAMGLVVLAQTFPMILLLLFGGVVADRFPRQQVMLWSDASRAVAVLLIAVPGTTHLLQLWHLVLLALFFGIVRGFFSPAYQSIIPQLVNKGDLSSANSLTELSYQLYCSVGPMLGASFVAFAGSAAAFAFDGFTFIVSALCLAILRLPVRLSAVTATSAHLPRQGIRSAMSEMREGLRCVAGSLVVALPKLVHDVYSQGVWLLGAIHAAGGIGSLVAILLAGHLNRLRRRGITMYLMMIGISMAFILFGLPFPHGVEPVAAFASALEQASKSVLTPTGHIASEQPALNVVPATSYDTVAVAQSQPVLPTETTPSADLPVGALEPTVYPGSTAPHGLDTPSSETPQQGQLLAPTAAVVSPIEPTMPVQRKARRLARKSAALLIGLVVVIIAGGVLGSFSLLAHFGVIGTGSDANSASPVRGGTWTDDLFVDPDSLIPNGNASDGGFAFDQALYLPLFYGDAQGLIHPGAATDIPTVQNGGISADATTWTFHLRPHLVWSDGQPYDARDVDFTWKLWLNPKFGASSTQGFDLISLADVSADHLSITLHLKQAYAPFLSQWVDGFMAPLPAHHFSKVAPEVILKSTENLNPQVVSGPFMMSERLPGDHYTLVRNPRYYRAGEGQPYLDKVVFRIAGPDAILKDLQAGSIDAAWSLDLEKWQEYQHIKNYVLTPTPTSALFEGLFFNFHNTVLASHLEVRQAMVMAIDKQALIQEARHGFATPLCTDHPSAVHPGYDTSASCPEFNLAAANKLLDDNGWVKGPDGVRNRGGQRLEFESSTTANNAWRIDTEMILQHNFQAIGIKLDIQNYPAETLFGKFLPSGKASPTTGAVAGRYDIAQFYDVYGYDPDDSFVLSCDQIPPKGMGSNLDFYCNPTLDGLYREEQTTADPGVRQQLFDQIHQIYLTQLPFIVLYSPLDLAMVRKGTHNYLPSPIAGETVNIWEWWCDGGKC